MALVNHPKYDSGPHLKHVDLLELEAQAVAQEEILKSLQA